MGIPHSKEGVGYRGTWENNEEFKQNQKILTQKCINENWEKNK